MTRDLVFHIQRFSLHDGPGIRTTVFVKGCAMSCFWCHNPEGRHPFRELQYAADRCMSCGECVRVCPTGAHELHDGVHTFLRERCRSSAACVEVCCSGALTMAGREMTVDEVMREVVPDIPFYTNSGGGVTISGGEPGLSPGFVGGILAACKERGIHTAIETCGYCSWSALASLLPHTDLVMMDLKHMSPEAHREATGNTNERILANAQMLAMSSKRIIFRTPVIPAVNDTPEAIRQIVEFIGELIALRTRNGGASGVGISYELLTFHKLGSDKYRNLGVDYRAAELTPPTRQQMQALVEVATAAGLDTTFR